MNDNDNSIQKMDSTEGWELAQRQAKGWSASDLVPKAYQDNVPNCLIAMEIADRIGASVMGVMQHLYVVHGKPAFEATFLIATVNASNRFSPLRYRMQGEEGKPSWGCRAYAMDKDSGEECLGPLVTMEMADKEGWVKKAGSKWQTMPELMLHYRAAAFWTRVFSPELSMGIHTSDEMQDTQPIYADAKVIGGHELSPMDSLKDRLKTDEPDAGTDKGGGENVEPGPAEAASGELFDADGVAVGGDDDH